MRTRMKLKDILDNYTAGDHDLGWWSIRDYFLDHDFERTLALRQAILEKGFSLADHHAPIKIRNGKVVNGHHRLAIALELRPNTLLVDISEEKS